MSQQLFTELLELTESCDENYQTYFFNEKLTENSDSDQIELIELAKNNTNFVPEFIFIETKSLKVATYLIQKDYIKDFEYIQDELNFILENSTYMSKDSYYLILTKIDLLSELVHEETYNSKN